MIRTVVKSFLVLLSGAVGMAGVAQAGSIAKVVAQSGSPSASGPGGDRALTVGSQLFENDKITVSGGGNAQILFVDGTKLVVGPRSSLVIDQFLLRGGSTAEKFSINALRGTFRFITGKSAKNAYDIKTANATIGIRGTGFDFWVQKNTGVAVLTGKVKLCNDGKESCVDLNAGCDLGLADNVNARELFGKTKVRGLLAKLPYTIDQRSLNTKFRLDISLCQAFVASDVTGGQGSPAPAFIPPPPAERKPNCDGDDSQTSC
jgi:FecR protein